MKQDWEIKFIKDENWLPQALQFTTQRSQGSAATIHPELRCYAISWTAHDNVNQSV